MLLLGRRDARRCGCRVGAGGGLDEREQRNDALCARRDVKRREEARSEIKIKSGRNKQNGDYVDAVRSSPSYSPARPGGPPPLRPRAECLWPTADSIDIYSEREPDMIALCPSFKSNRKKSSHGGNVTKDIVLRSQNGRKFVHRGFKEVVTVHRPLERASIRKY